MNFIIPGRAWGVKRPRVKFLQLNLGRVRDAQDLLNFLTSCMKEGGRYNAQQ